MKIFISKLIVLEFRPFDYPHAWKHKDNSKNLIVDVFDNFQEIHIFHENCNYNINYNEDTALKKILELL